MNYSEEEEEAIKIIEELLQSEEPICEYMLKHQEVEAMRKLLNIIETQKAEIENLKWKNNIYVKSIKSHKAEIERLEKQSKNLDKEAQAYLEELAGDSGMKERTIALLQAEIEKKDKMINLMAEKLVEDTDWYFSEFDCYTKEDFIKYFTELAEEEK